MRIIGDKLPIRRVLASVEADIGGVVTIIGDKLPIRRFLASVEADIGDSDDLIGNAPPTRPKPSNRESWEVGSSNLKNH